jgi:hypothetical protein
VKFTIEMPLSLDVPGVVESSLGKLAAQGSSWAIAAFLKGEGVTACHGGGAYNCPIAVYVNRELGIDTQVWRSAVAVTETAVSVPRAGVRTPTPDVVSTFVNDYDKGRYPDLRGK